MRARYADGSPAVVERAYGKGVAVWVGGFVGKGYHEDRDAATREYWARFFNPNGYGALEKLEADGAVVRLLETERDYLLVCLNRGEQAKTVGARIAGRDYTARVPARDGALVVAPK